ncbi:MAG: VOC family protein [Novosphingobium sp.]|nr:VOC family protein [Novosphingobium sp.]
MASQIPHGKTLDTDFMFTKLVVKDLARAVDFYSAVIGLVEMNRVEAEIAGRKVSEVVFMPTYPGGPMFILAQFHDMEKPSNDELILGFATKDIDAAVERAVKAGGGVAEPAHEIPGAGGMKVAFVTDPEGHLVQLSQTGG